MSTAKTRTEKDTFGPIEVPADRLWGAQTAALAHQLQDLGRADAAGAHPRAGPGEEGGGARQPGPEGPRREEGPGHRGRRRRGARRQARRRVPARGLADGQRHPEQHERERGAGQPRQRDPRAASAARSASSTPTTTSTRVSRRNDVFPTAMHVAAVEALRERRDPQRRARLRDALARQGGGLHRHRQDRPHPPAGRHAAHPGPGVLRLRGAARPRPRATSRRPCPICASWPSAAPPSARA